jgi:hypothetical protein
MDVQNLSVISCRFQGKKFYLENNLETYTFVFF